MAWRGGPPLLRKDFIFDIVPGVRGAGYGADAVLLIAAILNPGLLTSLIALARSLGLSAWWRCTTRWSWSGR